MRRRHCKVVSADSVASKGSSCSVFGTQQLCVFCLDFIASATERNGKVWQREHSGILKILDSLLLGDKIWVTFQASADLT